MLNILKELHRRALDQDGELETLQRAVIGACSAGYNKLMRRLACIASTTSKERWLKAR